MTVSRGPGNIKRVTICVDRPGYREAQFCDFAVRIDILALAAQKKPFSLSSHEGLLKPDPVVMSTNRRIRVDESSTERLIGQVA